MHMHIIYSLLNSRDILECIQSKAISSWIINKTFDFSTLHTRIPRSKQRDKLNELVVLLCFLKRVTNVDTSILSSGGINVPL